MTRGWTSWDLEEINLNIHFFLLVREFFVLHRMVGRTWKGVLTPDYFEPCHFPSRTTLHCGALGSHCFSSRGAQGSRCIRSVARRQVKSSQVRDQTCVPCTGRQIPRPCTRREVPSAALRHKSNNYRFVFIEGRCKSPF